MGKGMVIFGVTTVLALILSLTISVYSLSRNESRKDSDAYKAAIAFLSIGITGIIIWAVVSIATTKDDTAGSLLRKTYQVAS